MECSASFSKDWRAAREGNRAEVNPPCPQRPQEPRLCPLPHQPPPAQHCPYSPLWQISHSFSSLRILQRRAASPGAQSSCQSSAPPRQGCPPARTAPEGAGNQQDSQRAPPVGTGAGRPETGPRELTDEPDGRLSHAGLRVLHVEQALEQILVCAVPLVRYLREHKGTGLVRSLRSRPDQSLLPAPRSLPVTPVSQPGAPWG